VSGAAGQRRPEGVAPPPSGRHLQGTPDADPLTAVGERVRVAPVTKADLVPYRLAVLASRDRLAAWNPVDAGDLERHLRFQSSGHRTFIVHARQPWGEHDIVGRVNVTNVVRGRAMSASMGYDAYDPYAGRGLFAEGLRLVVDLALAPEPRGMGLHRVEASVQPGNVRSAGLLRSLGFQRRGAWPDYLWLPDSSGAHAWRDHVTYGVTAREWPAEPYGVGERDGVVVVLESGFPESGPNAEVGERLARELGVPYVDAAAAELLAAASGTSWRRLIVGGGGLVLQADAALDVPGFLALVGLTHHRTLRVPASQARDLVTDVQIVELALQARSVGHRAWSR